MKRYRFARDSNKGSRGVAGREALSLSLSLSLFFSARIRLTVDIRRGEFSFKPLICNYSKEKEGGEGEEEGIGSNEISRARQTLWPLFIFSTRIKYCWEAISLCSTRRRIVETLERRLREKIRVVMREIRASKFHDRRRQCSYFVINGFNGEDIETISFPRMARVASRFIVFFLSPFSL